MAQTYLNTRDLKDQSPVSRAATLARAKADATGSDDDRLAADILGRIRSRKESLEPEQTSLRVLFARWDNLYHPRNISDPGGADHWPLEKTSDGQVHVSVNNIPPYVDIPASLQAIPPVENYIATDTTDEEKEAAARVERLYFEWKDEEEFEAKVHQACTTKELYGFTYGKVWWNAEEKRPSITIIQRPDNLYVGWGASDFSRMDWAVFCYGLSSQAIEEEFGFKVRPVGDQTFQTPYVTSDDADPIGTLYGTVGISERNRPHYEQQQIEVYDYWYKKPTGAGKKPEIWNAIFAGNALVENAHHPEFDDIPYVPLRNTFLPGDPYGKSSLHDLEQLFREKDERITEAAQMIHTVVGGQMWQIVGTEAPEEVSANAIPKANRVAAPGPNARIEALQPFVPQFAVEDYLKRIDKELIDASGLSPVLLGNAPNEALSSSKAISALLGQYEARIRMKRDLLYSWRKRIWRMAAVCWERKSSDVRKIIDGRYRIDVQPPELTRRDSLEMAQTAINLLQNRIISAIRAADMVGVEDPESEMEQIKSEQQDPALNPQAVQAQVTLASAMASLGMAPGQQGGGQNPANGPTPIAGSQSLNGPENAANPPPESLPENAQAGNGARAQTLLQGGEAAGRILTQTTL